MQSPPSASGTTITPPTPPDMAAEGAPLLIAGAGIAGLAIAQELAHRNIACRIIERAEVLEPVGAGLQLPPNAAALLRHHAAVLHDALDERAIRPDSLAFIDGRSGRVLARMPLGEAAIRRWGAPARVLHRGDLQHALLQSVSAAGVPVHLGHTIRNARPDSQGVTVEIATPHGVEEVRTPVLIGADGIHSAVRRIMGDTEKPVFSGHIAWRALCTAERLPPSLRAPETGLWLGPGAHLVHYPISGGAQINMVAITRGPADAAAFDPRAFKAWSPEAQALVNAAESWLPWPLYNRPATHPWTSGRIALIGDAAHAMLPHLAQGAAQAIEDACALATSLAALPDAPEEALKRYEISRKPRAIRVQKHSHHNGEIYQMRGPLALARNLVLKNLGPERLMAKVDWLYGRKPD